MSLTADNNTESLSIDGIKEHQNLVIRETTRAKAFTKIRSLKRTMENVNIFQTLNKGILDYIAAVAVLAFACKPQTSENIRKLFLAVGKEPLEILLNAIENMHYQDYDLYLNIIYSLTSMKISPTIDKMAEILLALDEKPDAVLAGYVIEYYHEFVLGNLDINKITFEGEAIRPYEKMHKVTLSVYKNLERFVLSEITRILESGKISQYAGSDLLSHMAAACLLVMSSKNTDKGSIERVLKVFGAKPDNEILDSLESTHIRSYYVYIISLYFLNSVNQEQTLENVISVVRAFGVEPDQHAAEYVLESYRITDLTKGLER